ncbi:MAG: tetratricopeptide repeat protein [Desulfobacteraceae bacterium]|nr:MAG: tetratricopeptide repeat protein [Desulfobacteraceae bacterium]
MTMVIGKFLSLVLIVFLSSCATVAHQFKADEEYRKGLDLFKAEKYQAARDHVEAALAVSPDRPEYVALLGWTFFRQSRIEEARTLFSRADEMEKSGVSGAQGLAWVEYVLGNYGSSEKRFVRQLEWARDHMAKPEWIYYSIADSQYVESVRSDGAYGLGLIALARGKLKDAELLLSEALSHRNTFIGHGPVFSAFGDISFAGRQYKEAQAYYEKALAVKEDVWTASKRAWCIYHIGDNSGADKAFLQLLSTASDRRSALYGLVFTRHKAGKIDEAKNYLKELIRLDPYFTDTMDMYHLIVKTDGWRRLWKDFAEAYFDRGDFGRTAFKLKGYLPLSEKDCEAHLMNSWCFLYLDGPKSGLEEFTRLADRRLCPADRVGTGKGVSLLYLGRLDESERELEKAGRMNPENIRAAVALGAVAFLKGRYEKAIEIYTRNRTRLPKTEKFFSWPSHALNNLGWSCIKTGRYRDALLTFQELETLHQSRGYPEIFDGKGWSLFYLNRLQEAKAAFKQALLLNPQYASSLSGLSAVDGRTGSESNIEYRTKNIE